MIIHPSVQRKKQTRTTKTTIDDERFSFFSPSCRWHTRRVVSRLTWDPSAPGVRTEPVLVRSFYGEFNREIALGTVSSWEKLCGRRFRLEQKEKKGEKWKWTEWMTFIHKSTPVWETHALLFFLLFFPLSSSKVWNEQRSDNTWTIKLIFEQLNINLQMFTNKSFQRAKIFQNTPHGADGVLCTRVCWK